MEQPTIMHLSDQTAIKHRGNQRTVYFLCKRMLDLAIAGLALVFLAPLFVLIALLIKLDSPGPVLFVQKRVGARRRCADGYTWWEPYTFNFYKFRTMWVDIDHDVHRQFMQAYIAGDKQRMNTLQPDRGAASAFKLAGDARITKFGRFLRKSSLDELPQVLNVLKGEMSLVGPRPPIPYEVEMYGTDHLQRLATIPGITGLWQVSGRSTLSFDDCVRLDLHYIEHQSLWLDLKILLRTLGAVFSRHGAG